MKFLKEYKHLFYLVTALAGSILAIIGDFLIGYITPGAIGKYGFIQVGWSELSTFRLTLSLFFASIAFVLYLLGIYVIKRQIAGTSKKTAKIFYSAASGAVIGGLYIHVLYCVPMFVYQYLYNAGQAEMAIDLAYSVIFVMLPGAIITLTLMVFAFMVIIVATIRKRTVYSRWSILLNPLVVMILVQSIILFFNFSPFDLEISTNCVNAGLMSFFVNAVIYELKSKRKSI